MTDHRERYFWAALGVAALACVLALIALTSQPSAPPSKRAVAAQAKTCGLILTERRSPNVDYESACPPAADAPFLLQAPLRGYANGRLPRSVLAPIAQGYLVKSAAAAWNAMNAEVRTRYGFTIVPAGSMSSYRTYAQQQYLYRTCAHAGWCAYPGTSNHGWGLAVDLANCGSYRRALDAVGAKYGWAKRWSDASWECWHVKYRPGVWNGHVPSTHPTLRKGVKDHHTAIRRAQRKLACAGYPSVKRQAHYGHYDLYTRVRVKRFQHRKHLHADGVIGDGTWRKLLRYCN